MDKPGAQPNNNSQNVSHVGATQLTQDATLTEQSFSSTTGSQNALLVSDATVNVSNSAVNKTGDASGDNADFYGTNAAVFAYSNATLNITGGTITTNGAHANAVFAYDSGKINITDTKIKTSADNSGGIMVTGGGTLTAKNLTVETAGKSSAPIRSDRGGGTLTVEGGNYTSSGVGSPVIYSTANIKVKNANLTATASEGAVIEGLNSISFEGVTLTDTNNTLNGNSETYKNIFIYQSMSGDAETGTGTFTAQDSIFTTNKGDHFFITNMTAVINLTNNQFTSNDDTGAFLRAQTGKWGKSGSNGGKVTLNATEQEIVGDIIIDKVSSININLKGSYYSGTIVNSGTANLTLDEDSVVVLAGDVKLSSLTNAVADNSNIYAEGHKLYVAGKEVSINQGTAPESPVTFEKKEITPETTTNTTQETNTAEPNSEANIPALIACIGVGVAVVAIIVVVIMRVMKRKRKVNKRVGGE